MLKEDETRKKVGVLAPGKRVEETKVANDPMNTQRAEANLNEYIVICMVK